MTKLAGLSSSDVCRLTGATYRQLDYWTRRGYLTPAKEAGGKGKPREWAPGDVDQVAVLVARSADLRRGLVGV